MDNRNERWCPHAMNAPSKPEIIYYLRWIIWILIAMFISILALWCDAGDCEPGPLPVWDGCAGLSAGDACAPTQGAAETGTCTGDPDNLHCE